MIALPGISQAATTYTSRDYDPFHLYPQYLTSGDHNNLLNGDSDFFYQLRDITGATWNSEVGGPQWFATVHENYYTYYDQLYNNNTNTNSRAIYRRTMGGEIDDIPVSTIGDIIDGFNFVFAEEPEPYEAWTNYIYNNRYYDVYPDPIESLCLVITNGQTDLNVKFGNPYARHFPFWWNWSRTTRSRQAANWQWWKRNYDWTDQTYPTVEPVKYIFSPSDNGIYERGKDGLYSKVFNFKALSKDVIIEEIERRNIISGEVIAANAIVGGRDGIDATYVVNGDLLTAERFFAEDLVGHYLIPRAQYNDIVVNRYVISSDEILSTETVLSGDIISGQFFSGDLYSRDCVIVDPENIFSRQILTEIDDLVSGDVLVSEDGRARIPGYYVISGEILPLYSYKEFEPVDILSGELVLEDVVINDRYEVRSLANKLLMSSSGDVETGVFEFYSGDITRYSVSDDVVYDVYSDDVTYPLSETLLYRVSGDEVYDYDNNLVFTLEYAGNSDNSVYICEKRTIGESIVVHGLDDEYSVNITPTYQGDIDSGQYLDTRIRIMGDPFTYGSSLGYITFRQRASFAPGYTNFREATPIPLVIANVSNGNAEDNPLIFDMAIFDNNGDVVKRTKFEWDAQSNITKDLGTFFMMTPVNTVNELPYRLETRITNRTGTRYELYRYNAGDGGERNLTPAYWKYDLTEDLYGTLPSSFLLDSHSQIAPGLVTVYNQDMNYTNINMGNDQSASFRLYEHDFTNPKNLTLYYKRVAGMLTHEAGPQYVPSNELVSVQSFSMYFTDVNNNVFNTVDEIRYLTGKAPEMVDMLAADVITPYNVYIKSSAIDAFMIDAEVPEELQARVSYDVVSVDTASGDTEPPTTSSFKVADDEVTYNTDASGKAALQPISVRMKIPRKSQLLESIWPELEAADDDRSLFNIFARYGTVWVRSAATREYDTNLFTAIDTKGSSAGVSASDCVRAFIYNDNGEDYLYLDFIVIISDAKSKNSGRTAFIEVFTDDEVPYILIGDGLMNKRWELSFYVDKAGDNPTPSMILSSGEELVVNHDSTSSRSIGKAGGGGCNSGIIGLGLLVLMAAMKSKR